MTDDRDDYDVQLIRRADFDDWAAEQDAETRLQLVNTCALCGENTCAGIGPDPDPEGPAAFIHLKHHKAVLTICTHCADRSDSDQDLLDRCYAKIIEGAGRAALDD